jgi:hypothetical protein
MGVTLRRLPARVAEALSAVCAAPLEAGHQARRSAPSSSRHDEHRGRQASRHGPWRRRAETLAPKYRAEMPCSGKTTP